MQKKNMEPKAKLLEELVIDVKSVVKVNKGGRQRRFSATVVVGDRNGKVGLGTGKAAEVPDAIKKAIQDANKNIIQIPLIDGRTISHETIGTSGAARVILKPAKAGTGIIAGGSVRAVLESVGIHDVLSKSQGSSNPHNVVKATFDALLQMRSALTVAKQRGVSLEKVFKG